MTYTEIAQQLGIPLCESCELGNYAEHVAGWASISPPERIHWRRLRMTDAGLYRFLKLCGSIVKSHNRGQPEWQQRYEQAVYASEISRQLGRRLPAELSKSDRLYVRWARRPSKRDGHIYSWCMEVQP